MAIRLNRLKVHQFRDVKPGTELHFHDQWNVILGRNGSGKTTLLNLISMLVRSDLTPLKGEVFHLEGSLAVGTSHIEFDIWNAVDDSEPRSEDRDRLSALIKVQRAEDEPFEVHVEPGRRIQIKRGQGQGESIRESNGDPWSMLIEVAIIWEGTNYDAISIRSVPSWRFDEGLGSGSAITGRERGDVGECVFDEAWIGVQAPEGAPVDVFAKMVPQSLAISMARSPVSFSLLEERMMNDVPLLKRAVELLGFEQGVCFCLPEELSPQGNTRRWSLRRFDFSLRLANGRTVRYERLSFGQKRLLSFFWYLACNPSIVIADELANGMHYEWLRAAADAMRGRQAFLAVQNPLLLDHLGFDSPEDVQRSIVRCERVAGENHTTMSWSQPSEAQANEFFRSYKNGIQPIYEILLSEGLW